MCGGNNFSLDDVCRAVATNAKQIINTTMANKDINL
jgi:hypothetical protein